MKDWFLIRSKEVYLITSIDRPKGVQAFVWIESTKKELRKHWPGSTVFWRGNEKPETSDWDEQPETIDGEEILSSLWVNLPDYDYDEGLK